MIKTNDLMSILVLSCDKYRDLWDDFFTLLEKYWPDCNFKKYLATDTVEYTRPGVHVIHFGHEKNWTKCARIAVEQIDTPFISLFLEDAFICREINNRIINEDVSFANVNQVDFLTLERKPAFLKEAQWSYYAENIVIIPPNQKYGVDTAAAIWKKDFLLDKLKMRDCNAWQFEVSLCEEAKAPGGIKGLLLYDIRAPFNISPVEVVRLGKWRPQAIDFFQSIGYNIHLGDRPVMSKMEVFGESLRRRFSKIKYFRKPIKRIARFLGFPVFTDD